MTHKRSLLPHIILWLRVTLKTESDVWNEGFCIWLRLPLPYTDPFHLRPTLWIQYKLKPWCHLVERFVINRKNSEYFETQKKWICGFLFCFVLFLLCWSTHEEYHFTIWWEIKENLTVLFSKLGVKSFELANRGEQLQVYKNWPQALLYPCCLHLGCS